MNLVHNYPEYDDGCAAARELELEREQIAMEALMECKRAGVNLGTLETLAIELGLSREWQQMQEQVQP